MKAYRLMIAAAAVLTLAVVALTAVPDAHALMAWLPTPDAGYAQLAAGVTLATLRTEHADLLSRAAAKRKEITDGLAEAEVRRIEGEHETLVQEAEAKARAIAEQEARERAAPPTPAAHTWSQEDITRITGRATAFGLDAALAVAVMADPQVRTLEAATDALQNRAVALNTAPRQRPQFQLQADEGDKLRAAVGDSILLRANPQAISGDDTVGRERIAAARQFRGMSLLEVGRAFMMEGRQVNLRGLSRMEVATVLLGMRQASDFGIRAGAGMHSTSDFANILANVASKRLRDAYTAAPQTWKPFCRQANNPDFKTKSVVQLSSAPAFLRVREGQEYSYGGLTEGVEQYALATYGRIVAITRQGIINDDLNAFDRLPTMLGRAAATLENTTVYSILLANAAMSDTVALFHADHGNLLTGSAIDETNLGLARKAMREQTSLGNETADKEKLNLVARYLVTGSAYEIAAMKMLSAVQATATSGVNPFQGTMTLISDANVTGNKWFTIADPATIDTIEFAYLEGEEGVFIEQRMGFEVDGVEIKGRLDFAAKAIDYRGMTYNPGA